MENAYAQLHYTLYDPTGQFLGCAWALSASELVTCAHVVADMSIDITARGSYRKDDTATFIVTRTTGLSDRTRDATLLTAKDPKTSRLQEPPDHGIYEPQLGQVFSVFGLPDDKRTIGDFSRYEVGEQLPHGWIQAQIHGQNSSEIRLGYSGSPVWDADLQSVVGLVVATDPLRPLKSAYVIPPSILEEQIGIPAPKYPTFGPSFHDRLTRVSMLDDKLRRVEHFLSCALESVEDSVQRYWIYCSLGELSPDKAAFETLEKASSGEPNEFARRGVYDALKRFRQSGKG